METKDYSKQIVDFNKNAAKIGFDTIIAFSGQAAKLTESLVNAVPNVPEEVKKSSSMFFKEQEKSLKNMQSYVDGQLSVDWTSQDAPTKSIEVLEQFSKQAFSQANSIKDESKQLTEKATAQMPEEAKPLVNIWNDAINNSLSLFQDSLTKSLELSKELLNKESAVKGEAKAKATK
ncbi:MAG: hypothetical protein JRE16_02540 [Deltaproteobacteria bacterium]|jgi:hypothetical protein|nr:hypothetical protein [Deltaproteobacteria bacterium]MBW2478054.1 hypothetical protein [Deltaproteobacteria bacterium]MBW2503426.1 hypothetical protein [Deltaproteobacteria bacterium]MBW2519223.1 hypothetical protein [Deltaproteobacteria bacterium]